MKEKGTCMKSIRWLVCLLVLSASVTSWADKRYEISRVDIKAQVAADAGMVVSETRTYDFHGSYSYAYRTFPKNDTIRYSGFSVREGDVVYRQGDSKAPGFFRVEEENTQFKLVWYFAGRNESRTFTIQYRVDDLVKRYQDAAVLYYKFIGDDWQKRQANVRLVIMPPEGLAAGELREWVHGPLQAQSRMDDNGVITVTSPVVPAHTWLEVRALYPRALFTAGPTIDQSIVPSIMKQEAALAQAANEKRQKAQARQLAKERLATWLKPASLTLAGLALLLWGIMYSSYGRRPEKPTIYGGAAEIPDQTPPALVGFLLNWRMTTGNDMSATLMDLARRGFLQMHVETETGKGFMGKIKTRYRLQLNRSVRQERRAELLNFESSLLDFLFEKLYPEQNGFYLDQLRNKALALRKFFTQWQKEVKTAAEEKNYYDAASSRGMYISLIFGGVFFVLGLACLPFIEAWGVPLMASGLLVIIGSFLILHRTAEGELAFQRWRGLKRYIKKYHFKELDHASLMSRLDRYVIYGLVFGLYKKHYHELTAGMTPGQEAVYFPWYAMHGSSAGFSPASFSSAFSTMVSTMSSSAGFGGGATGGGGGGAGGGGGGAG